MQLTELQSLLRHRGGLQPSRPEPALLQALGGPAGVAELANDLYRRIAADPFLCTAFPDCFSPFGITQFLVEWFGGERAFSDTLDGGLVRAHQHRYVSPRGAAAWLECMRQALQARGLDPQPVLRLLGPVAQAPGAQPRGRALAARSRARRARTGGVAAGGAAGRRGQGSRRGRPAGPAAGRHAGDSTRETGPHLAVGGGGAQSPGARRAGAGVRGGSRSPGLQRFLRDGDAAGAGPQAPSRAGRAAARSRGAR